MSVKILFAIVLAAALAGIGVRLAAGPKTVGATTIATRTAAQQVRVSPILCFFHP